VLIERIAELVEAGVEPSSILALAFNKKANHQLVTRLGELGIPASPKRLFDDAVDGVRCATFNAFGYRFQRERMGLDFQVPEQAVWQGLMRTAAAQCGVSIAGTKRGSDPIGELLRARERALADLADPRSLEIEA
jgi:superfamily I DNA/RNA helicase